MADRALTLNDSSRATSAISSDASIGYYAQSSFRVSLKIVVSRYALAARVSGGDVVDHHRVLDHVLLGFGFSPTRALA